MLAKPEAERAVIIALGPGMGTILIPAFFAVETKINPGSLIRGVPASLIKATCFPLLISAIIESVFSLSLCA